MEEEPFYVGIKDPNEIRRNLLEASKLIIQNLQRYEKIKAIREEKLRRINELKRVLGKIKRLNSKLKNDLPKTSLRAAKEKPMKSKKPGKVEKTSEVKKLEKELGDIEKELSRLG